MYALASSKIRPQTFYATDMLGHIPNVCRTYSPVPVSVYAWPWRQFIGSSAGSKPSIIVVPSVQTLRRQVLVFLEDDKTMTRAAPARRAAEIALAFLPRGRAWFVCRALLLRVPSFQAYECSLSTTTYIHILEHRCSFFSTTRGSLLLAFIVALPKSHILSVHNTQYSYLQVEMVFAVTASILIASVAIGTAQEITGTYPPVPLASKGPFAYPSGIPYKVDTDVGLIRGTQLGYNICNSTTENQQSLCQTAWLNSIDDFCLWAPAEPGHNVGDIEGSMIAWCTKPGHGTRLIPAGALTGVQFMKTPDYVQVVGFFDQTQVNMVAGDYGGEMDPHGADLRGNPMGGIIYSDKFTGSPVQAIEWHNFIGSNSFCLKACDPAGPSAARYCEHIYDRIGCAYNAPNSARDRVFEACDGDSQDFPGVYTAPNGTTLTYHQPPESLGPITTVPYTARVPASSGCLVFESAALYTGLPSAVVASTTGGAGATATATATGGTGSVRPGATTGTAAAAQATNTSGASSLTVSACALGGVVLLSAVLLA